MPLFNRRPKPDKPKVARPRLAGGYGPPADDLDPYKALYRIAVTWLLFEEPVYTKTKDLYDYIKHLCALVPAEQLAALAIEVRHRFNLRRMPLFLARELARHYQGAAVGDCIASVVDRADELGDFVWLYWDMGTNKQPLSKQVKLGLGRAMQKFDEYQFAKWSSRKDTVSPRDVMFLVHGKPKDANRAQPFTKQSRKRGGLVETFFENVYYALANKSLTTPDTWEVALATGKDKKATFERLIEEKKLGDDAFLKNLRGMLEAKVPAALLRDQLDKRRFLRQLPTQFLAAAKHVPALENEIIGAMLKRAGNTHLDGHTAVVVDVSGSMSSQMSAKSEMTRLDAAIALTMVLREQCQRITIYATAGSDGARQHKTALVPNRQGMALRDLMHTSYNTLGGGGIFIVQVMDWVSHHLGAEPVDRVIVITDEQDCDLGANKGADRAIRIAPKQYILNVAPEKYGLVTGGKFVRISGFSDHLTDFIKEQEVRELFPTQ